MNECGDKGAKKEREEKRKLRKGRTEIVEWRDNWNEMGTWEE